MLQKKSKSYVIFTIMAYFFISLITVFCILPFLIIISGSLTDNATILSEGYHLIPRKFSLDAYNMIFAFPQTVLDAYRVTTINTLVGTSLGLFLISMAGYVLSRKDFKYRNKFSFFIYFTTIFGGGLVPWYIMMVKFLNLKDSYIALCLPLLMNPFLIILMRTFITSQVPDEILETAKIDGANHFRTYLSIVIPCSAPGLATVGLFLALNYWNDWYLSSLFITTPSKYELQFYLYNMLHSFEIINRMLAGKGVTVTTSLPTEAMRLAMAVIATGPVILFYPFVQRYFIAGITIGAVKG